MELPEDFQNGLRGHAPMEVVDGVVSGVGPAFDASSRSSRANGTLYRTQSQGSNRSDSSGSKPPSVSRGDLTGGGGGGRFNSTTSPTDGGSRPNSRPGSRPSSRQSGDELDNVGPTPLNASDLDSDLELGSMVEVLGNPPHCQYGVVKWLGYLKDRSKPIVGLEMEEESTSCTDGTFAGKRLFMSPPRKGYFVYLHKVKKDPRFEESPKYVSRADEQGAYLLHEQQNQNLLF